MAGRKPVGVYPHGRSGWRIQVKDPLTSRWKQVVATTDRFREFGVPLRNGEEVTKSDAVRLREKYEELLRRSASVGPTLPGDLALSAAIKDYLRFQRNAPEFLNTKTNVLGEFREVVGDQPIRDITKAHLQRFEQFLRGALSDKKREGTLHATTVARYLRYVRTFFNYGVREGWILRSPFVNFPIPADDSAPIEVYSLKELKDLVQFLRGTDGREYAIWMVAGFVGLGLRSMELQALDWSAFDPAERFVRIEKSKNAESRRLQPVPLSLMPLFEERRQESGPMFPTQSGNESSRNQMNVLGRRIAAKREGFAWRRLRRTYATLLQVGGVDSLIIDRLLGHSSKSSAIRVSARHYIGKEYAFYRSLVDEALASLGRVFVIEPKDSRAVFAGS